MRKCRIQLFVSHVKFIQIVMKMYVTVVLVSRFYLITHSITKISDELRLRAHTQHARTPSFIT
jgi:hypothetical protein